MTIYENYAARSLSWAVRSARQNLITALKGIEEAITQYTANDVKAILDGLENDNDRVHNEPDAPTKRQLLDVVLAMCSYLYHAGKMTEEQVIALTGSQPVNTDQIGPYLDKWV